MQIYTFHLKPHALFKLKKTKNDSHNPCGIWESSYYINLAKSEELLLVQCEVEGNGDSHRSTNHRVVAHTQEAHHLNVSRH